MKRFTCLLYSGILFALLGVPVKAQPSSIEATYQTSTYPAHSSSRQEMLERFSNERTLLVIYDAESPAQAASFRAAINQSRWGRWGTQLSLKKPGEVTEQDLQQHALLLVGTSTANTQLKRLSGTIPLEMNAGRFSFLGKTYTDPQDVITLLYPNPYNTAYPLYVVTGNDESAILSQLGDRLRNLDYQITRGGQRVRIGTFSQEKQSLWLPDPTLDNNLEDDLVLISSTENFRFYVHGTTPDRDVLSEIIMEREKVYSRVASSAWASPSPDTPLTYILYPSLERKAVVTNSMEFAHVDKRKQTIHVALEEGIRGDLVNKETILLTRAMIGTTPHAVFENGLGLLINETWFDAPYADWMARIAHAELQLPARILLDNTYYQQASPLLREPMAAAFVDCMINEWGADNFFTQFSTWKPVAEEWPIIETVWNGCVESHRANFTGREQKTEHNQDTRFQKGFNFAHEGYSITDGYGSKAANAALDKLSDMGVNAVSIIPYTGMRDPHHPVPLRFANSVNDENDGAIAHSARYAQSLGFTVMIKPQIWLRGSWPGDLDMLSDEDWDTFFKYYERWIGHYALLAELFEVDILCIGTELTHATMKHEHRWIDLANRLRSIYSGKIVYASNWGEEFENLTFWEAFDYIGLNSYYPLSDQENPTEAELKEGAERVVDRMRKVQKQFKKPLLLTEIGYPSGESPWILPYQEDRRGPVNSEHQALCYRIMIEALSDQDWLAGIYWWKWPSILERGGENHRDRFTPNGRPAQHVVANWFLNDSAIN